MSIEAVIASTKAEAPPPRKRAEPRDLFQLIGRAIDQTVENLSRRGVSLNSWVDPVLRLPREIDEAHLMEAVRRLVTLALEDRLERTLSIRAAPDGDLVRITAAAGGGRNWGVTLTAPPARGKVLVIDDDPNARVELAAAL